LSTVPTWRPYGFMRREEVIRKERRDKWRERKKERKKKT
jgi:hypothetical protein